VAFIIVRNQIIDGPDAQVHLREPDRQGRPWPGVPQRPPHRPNGFSAEEMLAEMDAVGVDRAVVVPPTWVGGKPWRKL
jgi:L-fuconolactonase